MILIISTPIVAISIRAKTIEENEKTAIGILRTLAISQSQTQGAAQIDQDEDGIGEYALLGELTGSIYFRGLKHKANPNYISSSLAPQKENFYGEKAGYRFQIWLPGTITDKGETNLPAQKKYANGQELTWRCYAWPIKYGVTGKRVFFIDQQVEVYYAKNLIVNKDGKEIPLYEAENAPKFNAAMNQKELDTKEKFEAIVKPGKTPKKDKQLWFPVHPH